MTSESRRFGLLIGVGEYPRIGERARLLGPAQDVRALKRVLTRSYGFQDQDLRTLVDTQATRAAILGGLDELVERARDGDQVLIHFSGHGSQIVDAHGDEPDGLDETLVPSDARRDGWEFSGDISDHEIAARLDRLERRGAFVTLNLDCCHSGHAHRSHTGVRIRRLPPPQSIVGSPARRSASAEHLSSTWLKHGAARRRVIFAACRDDQLAGEREIEGVCFGEWTWALVKALEQAEPGAVARSIFERAAAALTATGGQQWPILLGDGERSMLGLDRPDFLRHLTARRRNDGSWWLDGGAALGLVPGSRWTLVPVDTISGEPLSSGEDRPVSGSAARWGPLRLAEVGPFESRLELEPGARPPGEGSHTLWAVEIEATYGDRRLPVSMPARDSSPDLDRLREQIHESPYLRPLELDAGASRQERTKLSTSFWDAEAGAEIQADGTLIDHLGAVIDPLGLPPGILHIRDSEAREAAILERLERRARARLGLRLENRDPNSELDRLFDFRLLRRNPLGQGDRAQSAEVQGEWVPAHCDDGFSARFRAGELLAMELVHHYADGLYIYVLDFGLSDHVTQIYPEPGGAELLLPGLALSIGKQEYDELELVFPTESLQPEEGAFLPGTPSRGLGFVKAFATTSPTDFSWITTPDRAPEPHRGANRLESLLSLGRIQPSFRHRDDWTCIQRAIRLIR